MSTPEFSRIVDLRQCDGREIEIVATEREREALAERFALVRIDGLQAKMLMARDGDEIETLGRLDAEFVQTCALSAEELPIVVSEPLTLRFVPASTTDRSDEDREIDSSDPDEIEYEGTSIDLGEAVAQSLALAIDPFAIGPEAQGARRTMRGESDGPFAALAALKRGQDRDPR